ncbi:LysR family transcriptional regulator [Paenalcaligenes niemegkensis]|uniref:LysR family transcriptional regulator n=1 Tax=Paenalcaligenes niemegkensis TaxID=2895469 RepID=UPI001EE7B48A|nr:LysR family transcriptional regulator [Paenalcaligenes niemegkensis]MCQ9618215.1 LysR family transcriptional regulator [Paenalcaligenes niemegkensis]
MLSTGLPSISTLHALCSRLRFRQLRLLIAIDDLGSVHRVAKILHMTQPGVSKSLRGIEETFGVSLFVRSTQGLLPNEMGKTAIRHARLIYASLGHMRDELDSISRAQGNRIAVGTIAGGLAATVAKALLAYQQEMSEVSIDLYEDTSANLLEQLQSGGIDLAVCRTSVAALPELFDFEWLCDETVGAAVGFHHPLAKKKSVSLEDAAQYPWVLFPGHMPLRTLLERELASKGVTLNPGTIETSSTFATALLLAKSKSLVALFSSETIDFFAEHKTLHLLPFEIDSTAEPYGIVTRRGAQLSSSLQLFKERLLSTSETN